MGAWLAPVSRVLTHASASLRRLDREAGVTESLKLHIKFPSRPPPPASSILSRLPHSPSPSSLRARIASGSPNPKGSTSASSSPTCPWPKPIFKTGGAKPVRARSIHEVGCVTGGRRASSCRQWDVAYLIATFPAASRGSGFVFEFSDTSNIVLSPWQGACFK